MIITFMPNTEKQKDWGIVSLLRIRWERGNLAECLEENKREEASSDWNVSICATPTSQVPQPLHLVKVIRGTWLHTHPPDCTWSKCHYAATFWWFGCKILRNFCGKLSLASKEGDSKLWWLIFPPKNNWGGGMRMNIIRKVNCENEIMFMWDENEDLPLQELITINQSHASEADYVTTKPTVQFW